MNGLGPVAVAAGGTGGHLFPAAALSHALKVHGFEVHLITDERAAKYDGDFPAHTVHRLAAATPSGGSLCAENPGDRHDHPLDPRCPAALQSGFVRAR